MACLAEGPGDYCCDEGPLWIGEPRGEVRTVGGLQTYVASPSSSLSNRVLLFFPDVHGPFHINNQMLMDYFASKGYLVLSPDYFEGNPVQTAKLRKGFDRASWIQAAFARAKRVCPSWVTEVLKELEDTNSKIGTVGARLFLGMQDWHVVKTKLKGYCFGAPFALNLCKSDIVVAGAIAHPAFIEEDDFRDLKQPLLISCAETDNTFTSEARHRSEEILKEAHACYLYELFSGVRHGFALRGSVENAWARKRCADSFISWAEIFMVDVVALDEDFGKVE